MEAGAYLDVGLGGDFVGAGAGGDSLEPGFQVCVYGLQLGYDGG